MKNFKSIAVFGFLCLTGLLHSQTNDEAVFDTPLPVLNNRAYFLFPHGTVNSARQGNLMSADPNTEQETRLVYDRGDKRLVFFAQELYSLGTSSLQAEMAKDQSYAVKALKNKDQLLAILSSPKSLDSTQQAILVNSLIVQTSDNTLFRISAYINPAAYPDRADYKQLTELVFGSLMQGERHISLKAHETKGDLIYGKKDFTFPLPENYMLTTDQKYDFEVFNIRRFQPFGDTNWVSMTVYVGRHPGYIYKQYGLSDADAKHDKGSFAGENTDWLSFQKDTEDGKVYLREQIIPFNAIEKDIVVHVLMMSNSQAGIDELYKIVQATTLHKK